ncbi:HK97 family phage portal protein [Pararhizobium capsulatum DSM 1112]|uniref:HK97 family phage portal protein n=1 Tax=Pararhizobium capsulatum DSM 1112 TaxID=1121113 RepID=A0ABU0BLZ5_9HYPH|nr:phage portal protein [Pararhizobium capsulatum]MDQ0318774.1 HK97 family phage portal protein [Pararhizobium capsulatum DSM 1112]
MKLIDRILGREKRAPIQSNDPYLAEWFGLTGGLGGYVDPVRASGIATAHACISIVSQNLAATPLNLYRRTDNGGRERETDHPLYGVLHDVANPTMTAYEAREALVASVMIAGNAFARLEWNGRGQVSALYPLDPGQVAVERLESGRLRYRVSSDRGGVRVYLQEEILHLRYRLARDGVMGLSPIQIARETFSLALTQQETAAKQASKSFLPEGALIFPNVIGKDQRQSVLDRMEAKVNSDLSTRGILVLDGGTDWKSFSFSSKDAEFLESRKLTNLDICRIWGVPPTVAGITDNATYSNSDQESRALVVRCLAPMARRIEQAMNASLLTVQSGKTLFIEHDLAGLLRGDLKARYDAYSVGRNGGWLSVNEIRGWENMPMINGGNEYLSPLNMTEAGNRQADPLNNEEDP